MICPYCKETIQDEALKCRYCGSMLNNSPIYTVSADDITPDEVRAFIGTNARYYLHNFASFNRMGVEKFAPTWNWSCFGFTFLWMLYRKMYAAALVTFVIFLVPGVNFIMHIIAGVVGNYLYYRHVKEKILAIRAIQPAQNCLQALPEAGGVHRWVITWGIVASIILLLLFILFFASISATVSKFNGVVI